MTQQDEHGKPWYIHDQGWKVLIAAGDPRPWLRPEDMRPGRHRDTAGEADRASKWQHLQPQLLNEAGDGPLCRDDVLLNTGRITNETGTALDFRLLVITSDAGIGKSDTAEWIEYRLSQIKHPPYSAHAELVFRFEIRVLQERWREDRGNSDGERLLAVLQERFEERLRDEGVQFNEVHVSRYLRDVLRRGQMCFVLDGLDQVGDKEVSLLQRLLNSSECRRSRFIIAGRPNAVLSERRWRDLFGNRGWTWVQVEDFSRRQQVRYLGWLEDGSLRYTAIDRKARDLFSIPRVLSYLRNRSASELSSLKTASAVYASAIDHLLAEGVRQTLKKEEKV